MCSSLQCAARPKAASSASVSGGRTTSGSACPCVIEQPKVCSVVIYTNYPLMLEGEIICGEAQRKIFFVQSTQRKIFSV
jgi:hypothetical protein